VSFRYHRSGGLVALFLVAVVGCGDGPIDCAPCSGATLVDLSAWWDGTEAKPTALRVCVDGRCRVQPLRPDQLEPADRRVGVQLARPGTTIRSLSLDVLVGDRVLGRATGSELALPRPPRTAGCSCGEPGLVSPDPATGHLTVGPSPR
jgi:hypothetical protein